MGSAMKADLGPNFANGGMLWPTGWEDVTDALQEPQARTWQLGEHPLIPEHMPALAESRNVFLLALSNKGAGGDGSHEAFRKCFKDYLTDADAVERRRTDKTTSRLFEKLTTDYKELGWDFFSSTDRGLTPFTIKYLHYVMFGLDPDDDGMHETLNQWYQGQGPIGYYFWPMGYFMNNYAGIIDQVAKIYEASPALAAFKSTEEYKHMTKRELAMLCTTIMRLAGVQGFKQMASIALGSWTIGGQNNFPRAGPLKKIDQRLFWDKLDLDDTQAVKQYITECLRLDAPVSVTSRVATKPVRATIGGTEYTFAEGTKIAVPLALTGVDTELWGETAYQFNSSRLHLMEHFAGFDSFHGGGGEALRECPGKALAMDSMVEILRRLGPVRRANLEYWTYDI